MKKLSSSFSLLLASLLWLVVAHLPVKVMAQITNDLKAYYAFDNKSDATGLNPDAVLNGGATIAGGFSKLPYSLSSGGANLANPGYITVLQPNQLNFGDGSFTVAGWVRFDGHNNGVTVMGNTLSGSSETGWRIEPLSNGNWTFIYDSDTQGPQQVGFGGGIIPHFSIIYGSTGFWCFVAVTVNTTTGKIQGFAGIASLDAGGNPSGQPTTLNVYGQMSFNPGGSVTNSNPFYLGSGFSSHWDEFRAWNRVLSQTEIEALYNSGNVLDPCNIIRTSYQDLDGDGFGTTAVTSVLCPKPAGFSYVSGDCNDNNPAINVPSSAVLSGNPSVCGGVANLTITTTGTGPFSGTLSDGTAFSGNSSPFQVPVLPFSTTSYTIASLNDGIQAAGCDAVFTGTATVTVTGELAVTTGDSRNGPGVVNLSASGSGNLNWYDAPTGGNLVITGSGYSPYLAATQTFYVENEVNALQTYHIGLTDNSGGGNFEYGYYATHFNVSAACLFKSFTFYPLGSGTFRFSIYDNNWNNSFASIDVNVDESQVGQAVVVPVNIQFNPGDYLIVEENGTSVLLMGSENNFPYTVPNAPMSLTGTDQYFYNYCDYGICGVDYGFVYDLQAESGGICTSNRAPVTGTITNCMPPVIDSIIQPDCVSNRGRVLLSGLPETGNWSLIIPGFGIYNGSGPTAELYLDPGVFTFSLYVEGVCTSDPTAEVTLSPAPPCPVDCVVSDWSDWSAWSTEECGVQATRTRTRTIVTPAEYGGVTCPDLTETETRDNAPCPVDCVVSAWSEWSTCTKVCGVGMQTRTRTVITPAAYGGIPCPVLVETRSCNEQPCPVDCVVSEWSEWSTCTASCGGGVQTRTRTVITPAAYGGAACPVLMETRSCNEQPCTPTWYRDSDRDGYGNPNVFVVQATKPANYVSNNLDCRDNDKTIYPGAPEICDGKDNDCDGTIDEGFSVTTWYRDQDQDGYGKSNWTKVQCSQPSGFVALSGDCNDLAATVYPGATEVCDGVDNNCNGVTDEGCSTVWYRDVDKDGQGNPNVSVVASNKPAGYVANSNDCKDNDNTVYTGAPEICDGKDNDCDGTIDEGFVVSTWYRDQDLDGFGKSSWTKVQCTQPAGFVAAGGDCNDLDPDVYPGAPELCDGKDNDCVSGGKDAGCLIVVAENQKPEQVTKPLAKAVEPALNVTLWPNPAKDVVLVSIEAFEPGRKMEVVLMQADGKALASQSLVPETKGQQVRFDVRTMSSGYYLLLVKQGVLQQTKKVMIVR